MVALEFVVLFTTNFSLVSNNIKSLHGQCEYSNSSLPSTYNIALIHVSYPYAIINKYIVHIIILDTLLPVRSIKDKKNKIFCFTFIYYLSNVFPFFMSIHYNFSYCLKIFLHFLQGRSSGKKIPPDFV